MEKKPPVTLSVVGACLLLYYGSASNGRFSLRDVTLHPASILRNKEWGRFITSALFHVDELHLFYNLGSFVLKGSKLERRYGSVRFLGLISLFTLLSHGLVVATASVLRTRFASPSSYFGHSVGLSAVIFALKVVLSHGSSEVYSISGLPFTVPAKYIAWVELLLIQMVTPNASFLGHLSGIGAGLLYIYALQPLWKLFRRRWYHAHRGPSRFYGDSLGTVLAATLRQEQKRVSYFHIFVGLAFICYGLRAPLASIVQIIAQRLDNRPADDYDWTNIRTRFL
eukprot:GILJ01013650.1.p1 GENE.GILJ01013650.1~~GILJ01013650.1.p1  ORF type:complete len:323 (+),score=25.25 GILJ01013650.1:124-969(+)